MDKTYLALAYYATAGNGMSEEETKKKVKAAIKRAFLTYCLKPTETVIMKKEILVYDKVNKNVIDMKNMPYQFISTLRNELKKEITKNN